MSPEQPQKKYAVVVVAHSHGPIQEAKRCLPAYGVSVVASLLESDLYEIRQKKLRTNATAVVELRQRSKDTGPGFITPFTVHACRHNKSLFEAEMEAEGFQGGCAVPCSLDCAISWSKAGGRSGLGDSSAVFLNK